ncbi:MAG: T9SS type A sorting domain-containing protein, partial [Lentimicrobium sp.]|nr:T9SS type A sorting domain-containing protein [Lentimicrobium sp.]
IYNSTGKEIMTLVNEYKQQGSFEAVFNASGLPDGAYFYRLQAGEYSQTKKMAVIKN